MKRNIHRDELLVTRMLPDSAVSESYRSIRTSLKYSSLDKNQQIILFTSPAPGEGRTSVVSNLGFLTAQDHQKVLLIDGDLRRPHLHHIFQQSNRNGLSSILSGYAAIDDSIMETKYHDLHLLPAGPIKPNPGELLGSSRLVTLLRECKEQYDFIFIDTPPLLSVADAKIFARIADGIAVVLRANFSRKEQLKKAQAMLEPFRDKVIGLIMTDKHEDS